LTVASRRRASDIEPQTAVCCLRPPSHLGADHHPSSSKHPVSTLTRPDPSTAANNRTSIHKTTTLSKRTSPQHTHNNGLSHALRAPQRSFRPPCHQLRPDLRPSRLPDLATDARCSRRASAQACGRFQGNVSLSGFGLQSGERDSLDWLGS